MSITYKKVQYFPALQVLKNGFAVCFIEGEEVKECPTLASTKQYF